MFKNTSENTSNFAEKKSCQVLLIHVDFVIISYHSHLRFFVKQVMIFLWQWGSFITDTIFKRKYESEKVSNFGLFDTCAPLRHVSRNKWIDIHAHFSRNLKTLKKTSNLKISFFKELPSLRNKLVKYRQLSNIQKLT